MDRKKINAVVSDKMVLRSFKPNSVILELSKTLERKYDESDGKYRSDIGLNSVGTSDRFNTRIVKRIRPTSDGNLENGQHSRFLEDLSHGNSKEKNVDLKSIDAPNKFNTSIIKSSRPILDSNVDCGQYNQSENSTEYGGTYKEETCRFQNIKNISEKLNFQLCKNIENRFVTNINQERYNPLCENQTDIDDKCFVLNDLAVRFVKAPHNEKDSSLLQGSKISDVSKARPENTLPTGLQIARCCSHVVLLGLGGVVLFVGLLLGIGWPLLFSKLLQNELSLKENSTTLSMWRETPLPIYMEVYMFNWTNPEKSLRGPEKPKFVEMGPYVFYEHHSKGNLVWNANNTITYQNKKIWKFLPEMSNGTLSDNITNLNVVAMTIGEKSRYLNSYFKGLWNTFISIEESLVTTNTVGDLLFNGCNDRLLTIADLIKKYLKHPLPYDKFGWFYKRNDSFTPDGVFTMNTGTDDINKLGLLTRWNYNNVTGSYGGDCGEVKGTVGEIFPADSASLSYIQLFANDLCSSITLKAEKNVVEGNLTGTVFNGMDMFDNKAACFCPDGICPPSGVRNVSKCKDAPAFISLPHFLNADPSYREAVDGMMPDPEKHSFFMVLEEITSTPLNVRARLQMNILMDSIPGMNLYKNLKKIYIPMLWFDQRAAITDQMASQLTPLVNLSYYAPFVMFGVAAVGALLVTIGLYFRTKSCCQNQEERLLE